MTGWAFRSDQAVTLEGLQGLRQHFLADPLGPAPEFAPPLLTLREGKQDQQAPLAGDVVQYRPAGAAGRENAVRKGCGEWAGVRWRSPDLLYIVSTLPQSAYSLSGSIPADGPVCQGDPIQSGKESPMSIVITAATG